MLNRIDEKIQSVFRHGVYGSVLPSLIQGMGLVLSLVLIITMFWALYLFGPFSLNLSHLVVDIRGDGSPGIFDWATIMAAHFLMYIGVRNILSRYGVFKQEYKDDGITRVVCIFMGLFYSIFYGLTADIYNFFVSVGLFLYAMGSYMWEAHAKA